MSLHWGHVHNYSFSHCVPSKSLFLPWRNKPLYGFSTKRFPCRRTRILNDIRRESNIVENQYWIVLVLKHGVNEYSVHGTGRVDQWPRQDRATCLKYYIWEMYFDVIYVLFTYLRIQGKMAVLAICLRTSPTRIWQLRYLLRSWM